MCISQYPIRLVLNGPASKEIEWHCKHYVGRGLMKRIENGDALSKEFGLSPDVLKQTFEDYNQSVRSKKDPFGKKVRVNDVGVVLNLVHGPVVLPGRMELQRFLPRCNYDTRVALHHGWP